MNIRGLIVAAVVFFTLAGALYWSEHRRAAGAAAPIPGDTPPVILKLDESSITRLTLKRKDAETITLARDSGVWKIIEPRPLGADQSTVSSIVSNLSPLNSERLVEEKAADRKPYGLDSPSLELDITEKDNKTQSLLIGDDTPASGAVYAMLAADPRVFTMSRYVKTSVDKSLNDLRDKRLLTVNADKISRIAVLREDKKQEIEFGRNKDEWQILQPRPLRADNQKVGALARQLTDAKMDLGPSGGQDAAAEFARAKPMVVVKVTDESATQELQVRRQRAGKNPDAYYVKSTAVDGAYKIDSELGRGLEKGLEDYRNPKLFDFNEPSKIELHDGSKAYFLTRSGEDWWSNGKKMDSASVQSLIGKLRDLTAVGFPDSGFGSPTIEAVIASEDGRRVEKVLMAKSDNGYVARRDNEPALYRLDSAAVDDLQKAAEGTKLAAATGK